MDGPAERLDTMVSDMERLKRPLDLAMNRLEGP